MDFRELHMQDQPLLVGNVWDVASTQAAEQSGYCAVGTSSAAIASSQGLEDGETLKFDDVLSLSKQIVAHTSVPVTVDIEGGYSRDPAQIAKHVIELANVGVTGVNIEDSVVDTERGLVDPAHFAACIDSVKQALANEGVSMFLNIRTDTFLLNIDHALEQTKKRILLYQQAGADGIFVPCLETEGDIRNVAASTELPLNVMCTPSLLGFEKLKALGVKRISMGNYMFEHIRAHMFKEFRSVLREQSFQPVFFK